MIWWTRSDHVDVCGSLIVSEPDSECLSVIFISSSSCKISGRKGLASWDSSSSSSKIRTYSDGTSPVLPVSGSWATSHPSPYS
ncbi:hypothetical protein WICPIJ_002959 [Wickerhamomyces pijperi]|uniref:Uncharacterized protein n=1 Tax=Wickerhamomyces pijperi TaxID=599730 RepID=A0A9P8Q8T2_WICPI|nr:hypothetical protein WICPIJ_002959 [Wickerhamomyces pijperi]